jgi:hypothetical protein
VNLSDFLRATSFLPPKLRKCFARIEKREDKRKLKPQESHNKGYEDWWVFLQEMLFGKQSDVGEFELGISPVLSTTSLEFRHSKRPTHSLFSSKFPRIKFTRVFSTISSTSFAFSQHFDLFLQLMNVRRRESRN